MSIISYETFSFNLYPFFNLNSLFIIPKFSTIFVHSNIEQ